jgi:hypothetical protein
MSKKDKSWLAGWFSLLLMSNAILCWPATSGTVDLEITPTCTEGITVSIAGPAPYQFGSVGYTLTTYSTRAVTVVNTGSCSDSWYLSVADSGAQPWTAGAAAGVDTYSLKAVFNSGTTQPTYDTFDDTNDVVDGTPELCDGTKFDGDESCQNVLAASGSDSRNLWFKLVMPTESTDASQNVHTLTVTVATQ